MDEETFQVHVRPETSVTAVRTMPDTEPANGLFIYAPGAGSNINDPFGSYLSQRLVQAGFAFVRFQFPYMEAGKRRPDQTSLLEETWKQVIETVKIADAKVIIGGRSMGGRIASHVAAQGLLSTQWPCLLTLCIHRGTQPSRGTVTCRKSRLRRFSAPAPGTPSPRLKNCRQPRPRFPWQRSTRLREPTTGLPCSSPAGEPRKTSGARPPDSCFRGSKPKFLTGATPPIYASLHRRTLSKSVASASDRAIPPDQL